MIDLNKLQPVKISTDINSYSSFVYGPAKIGKTTFIEQMAPGKVLHVMTEKRFKTLSGAFVIYVKNFTEFMQVMTQLRQPKFKKKFQIVSIDTVENLHRMLEKYVAQLFDETQVGERNDLFGKDWTMMKSLWFDNLKKIEKEGYVPNFVSHSVQEIVHIPKSEIVSSGKEVPTEYTEVKNKKDGKTYLEFNRYAPDMRDKDFAPINNMVDNILFLNNTIDDQGKTLRVIHLRPSLQWIAGSTFKHIAPTIPLTVEAYQNAVNEAISKESDNKDDYTDERQADADISEEEVSYKDLQKRLQDVALKFKNADKIPELLQISESFVGKGNRVTDLKESQKEVLQAVVEALESKVKTFK